MKILSGKEVAENLKKDLEERINKLKRKPSVVILGIKGDDASDTYFRSIKKNCDKYNINLEILMAEREEEFINNFNNVIINDKVTGIMFQQPLPKNLSNLINEIPVEKDIEGLGYLNKGKLFVGTEDKLIPCTSKAVIEIIDYYNIDLTSKNVVVIGRSNIVGKPLIPQLLEHNATVTITHSKTKNIKDITRNADVIITAIGKAKFLTKDMVKEDTIIIDVGTNYLDGKLVGDVDFDNVSELSSMITPVPGGVGVVTNAVLLNNIVKSAESQENNHYKDTLINTLNLIENKNIEIAGGAVVGMIISITNSLIKYISNLTIGKKNYLDVEEEIKKILNETNSIQEKSLNCIDKDKKVLEELLLAYKNRKEDITTYQNKLKEATNISLETVKLSYDTYKLIEKLEKIGNKNLISDCKISKYYAESSLKSGIVNVEINLNSITNEEYKNSIRKEYNNLLNEIGINND